MSVLAIGAWFFKSNLSRSIGLGLLIVALIGGIYLKGRSDENHAGELKQQKQNDRAAKQRDEIDRSVPRTDWPDRVDELR